MADQQEQMYYERRDDGQEGINKNVEGHGDQVKERGIFDVLGGKKEEQEQMYYERRDDGQESIDRNAEGRGDQVKERGIFDVLGGKKEEEQNPGHDHHQVISTELEKAYFGSDDQHQGVKEEEKPSLTEKLHRSHSTSSTSSSDEEEGGQGGDKNKKKEKNKAGIFKDADDDHHHEYSIEDQTAINGAPGHDHGEEKKGFIEKIKEKLPGVHHKDHGEENN